MGISPSPGIPCRSRGQARRSAPLHGPCPSVLLLALPLRARTPHELGEAPTPPLAPLLGRRWPAVGEQRHRSTMRAVEPYSELLPCLLLVHRVRLVAGELLVVTTPSASSPSTRAGRSAPPLLRSDRQVRAVDRGGPLVSALDRIWVHSTGCTQYFCQLIFKKSLRNDFSDFCEMLWKMVVCSNLLQIY